MERVGKRKNRIERHMMGRKATRLEETEHYRGGQDGLRRNETREGAMSQKQAVISGRRNRIRCEKKHAEKINIRNFYRYSKWTLSLVLFNLFG